MVSLVFFSTAHAQTSYLTLVRSPDAREVAMGESYVAGPLQSFSIENNPAVLAQLTGMTAFYSYRDLNWFGSFGDFQLSGAGAMIESPIGNFALLYKRFTLGEINYSSGLGPEVLSTFNQVDQTYILGYGSRITDVLAIGVNAKLFYRKGDVLTGSRAIPTSKNSYLFDVGVLYALGGITSVVHVVDQLNVGFSLQNFGSDFETALPDFFPSQYFVGKLPRFARSGFSYSIQSHPGELYSELGLLVTAEYRRYVNPQAYESNRENFWGFGMEISALQIAAIRLGGVIQPYSDIFGDEGQVAVRYGLGIRLPGALFGLPRSLMATFDYSLVPLNGNIFGVRKTLPVMHIQLKYDFTQAD